jgi:CheY-like chemotaxis protein
MGRLFRRYVAGTGYGLVHVRTAERAIQVSRQSPPDVFVLDVLLPSEDGWQLLERLRAEPRTAETPVIVCSILPEETLATSLGIAGFLPKPINQPDLLATLARCCPLG